MSTITYIPLSLHNYPYFGAALFTTNLTLIFRSTDFDLWLTGIFQASLFECRFGDILWSSVDSAVGADLLITVSVPRL